MVRLVPRENILLHLKNISEEENNFTTPKWSSFYVGAIHISSFCPEAIPCDEMLNDFYSEVLKWKNSTPQIESNPLEAILVIPVSASLSFFAAVISQKMEVKSIRTTHIQADGVLIVTVKYIRPVELFHLGNLWHFYSSNFDLVKLAINPQLDGGKKQM